MRNGPSRRLTARRVIPLVVAAVVVVLVFTVVLPRIADYGEVWKQMKAMSATWLLLLIAADVVNLATYAPNWMAALPGLRYRQSLELSFTGTAIANVAPLGGAVSMSMQYAMLREWAFTTASASRAMVLTGVWNNVVNLSLPVVGLLLLGLSGGRNAGLEAAARVGGVLLVIMIGGVATVLASERGAAFVGRLWVRVANSARRWVRKGPVRSGPDSLVRFRLDSLELLRRRWLALTVATYCGVLTVFVVLLVAVRAVGITGDEVSEIEVFAAWSTTRLLSAIPITPGGLGIIEVGLTGAMAGFGGPEAQVVAAVLVYRLFTYLPPILLGAIAAFTWRRSHPTPPTVVLGDAS